MGKLVIVGVRSELMHHELAEGVEEIVWEEDSAQDQQRLQKLFHDLLMKGWIAYTTKPDGRKAQIFRFDPKLAEIVLLPMVSGG